MNRSYRIIPSYTGDISGIASALFELGGMVVIHDPSGCNSTYNTHDEIRWYDQDSLIFITGLSQTDAIMGDDEKLIREVEEAAQDLQPAFIALTGSPIPYMNGTDFKAIAKVIEADTKIPCFWVPKANGMHDYVLGAGNAFLEIARRFVKKPSDYKKKNPTAEYKPDPMNGEICSAIGESNLENSSWNPRNKKVNILGVMPLDFAATGFPEYLRDRCQKHGWTVQSCWAMGDSLESLKKAAEADVNLVVSATGMKTAKYMEETFGIPYCVGIPMGPFENVLMERMEACAKSGISAVAYKNAAAAFKHVSVNQRRSASSDICAIGEPVFMKSLAAAMYLECGEVVSVICPLEADPDLLETDAALGEGKDCFTDGEEEAEQAISSCQKVFADPLYRPICPLECQLVELPHLAFSGRCFISTLRKGMDSYFSFLPREL